MKYSGAEIIVRLLERQGIEMISGIPGGANLPLYDALRDSPICHILARHEQGAGFIAQGMARSTGHAAVCLATSGPGATNLITAIADAKMDSIPIIAITGQVTRPMIGTDAFQEVDTYGLTLPVTKHNFLVKDTRQLLDVIPEAFKIAESGRPGPVVIDVPKDVQMETITVDKWPETSKSTAPPFCTSDIIDQIADMIHLAKRPVLYTGGGIISANASGRLRQLARKNSIPVASTLMGLGGLPTDDPLFLGMLGMHGAQHTNFILEEADLILAFGIRFDDRATGNVQEFCKYATIIHIDVDHSEIDKIKPSNLGIVGDIGDILLALVPKIRVDHRSQWNARIAELREMYPPILPEVGNANPNHPVNIIKHIGNRVPADTIITTDVGQHQMWTAQVYPFRCPRTFLTSGGLGTMGFGVPVAIGAALANRGRKVVCISGDGSFLMNIQELATIAEHHLNITTIIMNNGHLGLVRQQQALFYNNRLFASRFEGATDFAAVAKGFGITGYDLTNHPEPISILSQILKQQGPMVVNIPIDSHLNVYPMVPPGAPNREMIGGEMYAKCSY